MSNCENPKNFANFSARLQLVAGTLAVAEGDARFINLNNCSVIQGLVRTTPGGVFTGIPRVIIGNISAIGVVSPPVTVFAPVNTDTSLYTLFWQNEVLPGANAC